MRTAVVIAELTDVDKRGSEPQVFMRMEWGQQWGQPLLKEITWCCSWAKSSPRCVIFHEGFRKSEKGIQSV